MHLYHHLKEQFPARGNWIDAALIEHFMEEFGVNAKSEEGPEGAYWIFKYGMIEAKWKPVTRECRGAILHRGADEWQLMSWPFNKFFNQHEGHSLVTDAKDFGLRMPNFYFAQKLDGSCIQLWFDYFNKKWRASTLGMITTTKISGYTDETFESMFWKLLGEFDGTYLPKAHTYIFELCSTQNRIVTQYEEDALYYLGCRNLIDGDLSCSQAVPGPLAKKVAPTRETSIFILGLTTLRECKDWVEAEASSDQYGKYPEGFVVYDDDGPVCKMKNSAYLVLYHASGAGNLAHSRNCAIDSFWKGTIDDIWEVLPDEIKEQIEILKEWYRGKIMEIIRVIGELRKQEFKPGRDGQKDYALVVQKHVDRKLQAFFFQDREKVEDNSVSGGELFAEWMRINAGRWSGYWKEIMDRGAGQAGD